MKKVHGTDGLKALGLEKRRSRLRKQCGLKLAPKILLRGQTALAQVVA